MELTIVFLYVTLLLELVFFHVPSVANTSVFFTNNLSTINQYNHYQYVFRWSNRKKIIWLLIPHVINIVVFFVPLLCLFFEKKHSVILLNIGVIMAFTGRLISFLSMLQIRQGNLQKENDFRLHTTGFFSFSRNPIQVGMYLFYLGICLINFNPMLLLCFLFYFFYNDFRIKIEEDFLEVKFKEHYIHYKLKTRRYL